MTEQKVESHLREASDQLAKFAEEDDRWLEIAKLAKKLHELVERKLKGAG